MLEMREVQCRFGGITAVRRASLRIEPGEMVGIIGRSGAGKSSLLRLVNRLYTPQEGSITWNGRSLLSLKGRELRDWRRRATIVFQQFNLIPRLDVLTNVLLGTLATRPLVPSLFKFFPAELRARAIVELDRLGMAETAFQRTQFLSGGQQQRVAIARAMMQDPEILLADEPVASLDPINSETVMESIAEINRTRGITVLVNLHSIDIARRYCRRIIGMRDGEIVFDGPVAELTDAAIDAIYGSKRPRSAAEVPSASSAEVRPALSMATA